MLTQLFFFEDSVKHSADSHYCSCLFRHSSEMQRYGTWKVLDFSDFTVWWQCYILQIHCKSSLKRCTSTAVWKVKELGTTSSSWTLSIWGAKKCTHLQMVPKHENSPHSSSIGVWMQRTSASRGWAESSLWQSHILVIEKGQPNTWTLISNLQFSFL